MDLDGSDFYSAHLRGSIVGDCPKGVTAWTHSTHSLPVLESEREARVRVGCKINGRQTALGGVRSREGPTNQRNSRSVLSPPFFQVPMVSALECPRGMAQCLSRWGHSGHFYLYHGWDFSVPLGGVSRLEQLSQGFMPPVRPQATAGGIRGAVIRRGPHSERK